MDRTTAKIRLLRQSVVLLAFTLLHADSIGGANARDRSTSRCSFQPLLNNEKCIGIPNSGGELAIVTLASRAESCTAACNRIGRSCDQSKLDEVQQYAARSEDNFCHFVTDVLGLSFNPGNHNVTCQGIAPNKSTSDYFGIGCSSSDESWQFHGNFAAAMTGCASHLYQKQETHVLHFVLNSTLQCDSVPDLPGNETFAPQICACNLEAQPRQVDPLPTPHPTPP